MKAFQVNAAHDYQVTDVAAPTAAAGEVLVRVARAGICGSDIHIVHGDNAFVRFPRVTGHEFSGTIEAVGAGVGDIAIGDRVCVDPVLSCGDCYPCRIGRQNVCTSLQILGVHRDGGFAEYVAVPVANAHKLPDGLSLDAAALVEPFSIAMNVLDRIQALRGDQLLVYGAGTIGLTIVQMARARGIERIFVTDIVPERLETAREMGASHVLDGNDCDVEAEVMALTDDKGVPLIADAASVPALLPQMLRLACPAGRIGLLGFSQKPSDLVQAEVIQKELTLVGSRVNNHKFPKVIELMINGSLNPLALISHRLPFAEMNNAVELLEKHPEITRKIQIQITSGHG